MFSSLDIPWINLRTVMSSSMKGHLTIICDLISFVSKLPGRKNVILFLAKFKDFLFSSLIDRLWDLDIKFVHDLTNENLPRPIHVNAPSWHPSHISTYEGKQPFLSFRQHYNKFTTPPVFPAEDGFNFTESRVIEMPPYHMNFLDKDTIWREPLFHVKSSVNDRQPILPTLSYKVTPKSFPTTSTETGGIRSSSPGFKSSRESRSESSYYFNGGYGGECWSYQALSSTSSSFTTDSSRLKPPWHFKDLRSYFNQR